MSYEGGGIFSGPAVVRLRSKCRLRPEVFASGGRCAFPPCRSGWDGAQRCNILWPDRRQTSTGWWHREEGDRRHGEPAAHCTACAPDDWHRFIGQAVYRAIGYLSAAAGRRRRRELRLLQVPHHGGGRRQGARSISRRQSAGRRRMAADSASFAMIREFAAWRSCCESRVRRATATVQCVARRYEPGGTSPRRRRGSSALWMSLRTVLPGATGPERDLAGERSQ